ncbi:hypothetical protein SK128_028094 [Halocaridina rubra]|uniref:Uncharacterized protein n=1 Tax=Halocaridina rubra TaxID=373956 RepID=A0AAN9AH15_HALRR
MSDEATKAASGLAKMSLEDFLQEDISTPSKGSSPAIFQRPTGLTWENGRAFSALKVSSGRLLISPLRSS